ncbi:hypothetical protein BJV77DRAFT_960728 [Russula vinacea]|nr:hypothetical protein BJV77DRAFT_960728 [Russula vinacea]
MCRAIQGQWAPTKDILGPADVIGRNYFKSTRPIQEHRGYPPKTFWAQLMSSVEASPGASGVPAENILGPADVIGRHYSKSAEPIQEHQGHPPKQFWAQPMSPVEIIPSLLGPYRSIGGTHRKKLWAQLMSSVDIIPSLLSPYRSIGGTRRNSSGPSRWRRQTLFRVCWAHTWPLGALTKNMLGPANVIGRNYSKSAGPIQEHREHPPKQFWAQLMASVDIIPRALGAPTENMLGPANVIGRHYSKSAEPIQEHLRNPPKKLWAQQMSSVEIIPRASGEPTEKTLGPADVIGKNYSKSAGPIQKHRGNPLKNILGPADVIDRNYSKSAGPMQEHRGHPPKRCWAQLMASVEIIPSLLGPCRSIGGTRRKTLGPADVIGRHYPKSVGPIQGHRVHPPKQFWAQLMASGIGGTHRKSSGSSQCHRCKLFQVCWAHTEASGAPTKMMLGPADVIGKNCSKSAGPIQEHRGHPPKQFWAQPMALVEIISSLLGPYMSIGGTCQKTLGPADVIGKHYFKSAGPTQGHRGHPPKQFWAQLMASVEIIPSLLAIQEHIRENLRSSEPLV